MENLLSNLPFLLTLLGIVGLGGGLLAGLFGVGGGILFVPALFYTFNLLGFSEFSAMHLAVGTSLAISVPTTMTAYFVHKKKERVDNPLLESLIVFLVLGVLFGAYLATQIEGKIILRIFSVFLIIASFILVYTTETKSVFKKVPKNPLRGFFAMVVGSFSSLIGISGGTITVPKLVLCGMPIKKAVGTASAVSFVICFFGTLGHIATGSLSDDVLPYSLGYVNVLAFGVMAPLGFIGAKIGTHTAARIHADWLRWTFAGFLVFLGVRMAIDAF